MPYKTRFAPSPTGFLHLGHIVSAKYAHLLAGGGENYLVRIEDCDEMRCQEHFKTALIEDLKWLGLWPEKTVRVQSQHKAVYRTVLKELQHKELLYPCWCSRRDVSHSATEMAPDGSLVYSGKCRNLSARKDQSVVPQWRLDMQSALEYLGEEPGWTEIGCCAGKGYHKGNASAFGDVGLARRDTGLSYHLCVTIDDALQGVTCVTRGMDLEPLTAIHRVLQKLMKWPEPVYAHHALIMDAKSGKKLSKRDGSEGVHELRQAGWSAAQIMAHPLVQKALSASLI